MDKALIDYLVNISALVPIVLILIVISLKLSRKGIDKLNVKSYAQVIERFTLNKDTTLYVIKIGKSGCVLVSSQHNTTVIKDLNEDEMKEIIEMKSQKNKAVNLSEIPKININNILNNKFKRDKSNGYTK